MARRSQISHCYNSSSDIYHFDFGASSDDDWNPAELAREHQLKEQGMTLIDFYEEYKRSAIAGDVEGKLAAALKASLPDTVRVAIYSDDTRYRHIP